MTMGTNNNSNGPSPVTVAAEPGPNDMAIVGFSFMLPQDVNDEGAFWDVLQERKNLSSEWPESRMDPGSFVGSNNRNANKVTCSRGHFIQEDVGAFDAPFFSLTAKEAASMDPLQRWTLETSYRAFEKAGMPFSSLRDSRTAVFSASMTEDWARMAGMDPDNADRTVVTGTVASLIPNRISFYFGLHGPSLHVDTACSGSLSALDMACKALSDGDASAALVTGSNLILDPSVYQMLSSQNFLSPKGLCHSFDHRADGYARGEGVIALVLKPLAAAVQDGDVVRAVIRGTASNQDGRTPGLTQPSPQAQEALIRHVYAKAGLGLEQTRYIEAHGTGTPVGDPIEMKAIGRVFRKFRSPEEPLYVGSVKANIGHLEGASGLAGVLKAIMMLEKGVIPPNANFEKMNPDIDADFYNVAVATANVPWPTPGLRRISVNSFGFGGSNTHVILDDAYHYMQERGLAGNHCTVASPPPAAVANGHENGTNGTNGAHANGHENGTNGTNGAHANGHENGTNGTNGADTNGHAVAAALPTLLVWSAADEKAAKRTTAGYEAYYASKVAHHPGKVSRLAWTLAERRSHMLWRAFAIVDGPQDALSAAAPVRSSGDAGLAFVFTGQGAQYVDMGWDLMRYPVFAACMRRIDGVYQGLGSSWSIFDELRSGTNIDKPEYSQPLATAVQLALVELLESFGIVPKAVVGHSSGEIAAAYTVGALSLEAACKASYFRGQLAGQLRAAHLESSPGAMLSINVTEAEVKDYLQGMADKSVDLNVDPTSLTVACINSPVNCTLSGPEAAVDAVRAQAEADGIFAAKLKTGVAYHSAAMLAIADRYRESLGQLAKTETDLAIAKAKARARLAAGIKAAPIMVSSVTGQVVRDKAALADAQYWVDNLVSPVRFADALRLVTQSSSSLKLGLGGITDLVEVGPHAALKRPVQDTLGSAKSSGNKIRYASALYRGRSAVDTTLELAGSLFCLGHAVSVTAINGTAHQDFLVDCPGYPFDHSQRYWAESRISQNFRLRGSVAGDMLGMRATDWNPLAPRWRSFLSVETVPWIGDHVISKTVLLPAAGMLIMAIEAVQQFVAENSQGQPRQVSGFMVKEARFDNPIVVRETWEDRVEVQTQLRPARRQAHEKEAAWYDVVVSSYSRGRWTECCTADIRVEYADAAEVDGGEDRRLADEAVRAKVDAASGVCSLPVDSRAYYRDAAKHGLEWGDWFQVLQDITCDSKGGTAVARVDTSTTKHQTTSIVHPALLDSVFHVLRVAAGQLPSTNVPVRLAEAWFSASGWQQPQTSSIRWMGTGEAKEAGTGERGSLCALADDGSVLCTIREAETTAVSTTADQAQQQDGAAADDESSTTLINKRHLMHTVEWLPQLSLLDKEQLNATCKANEYQLDEDPIMAARAKLYEALQLVNARALAGFLETANGSTEQVLAGMKETLRRHIDWMRREESRLTPEQRERARTITDDELEAEYLEIEELLPAWKLYTVVARELPGILAGRVDPLQVIFETNLAAAFYKDIFGHICSDGRLSAFLELAAHERPALRILEIGAGTGGVTGHVIRMLQEREAKTGAPTFAEYTYTDISPMFFEGAMARWPDLQGRMSFKTLDVGKDIDQGSPIELGSYDLVVAGSVLHATPDLELTLRNVRKALRPGGHLVLLEVIDPDDIVTNFWTGLVPGWWVAHEDWRPYSAAVPEGQWDKSLRNTGFSGSDMIVRDYKNDECHFLSIIVSKAVEEGLAPVTNGAANGVANGTANGISNGAVNGAVNGSEAKDHTNIVLIVNDAEQQTQKDLANQVIDALHAARPNQHFNTTICSFSLDQLASVNLSADNTVAICLAEAFDKPVLASLSEAGFQSLQHLVKHAPSLLWVTAADARPDQDAEAASDYDGAAWYPHFGAAQGFLRTIRCEQPQSHVVSLAIEGEPDVSSRAGFVAKVFADAFVAKKQQDTKKQSQQKPAEVEYVVRNGQIQTGRALLDPSGNANLRSLLVPRLVQRPWADAAAPGLRLEVGTPGALDSLRFVEDDETTLPAELGPHEVEIEAKAWGLNFRDVLMALGREEGHGLGADCAGVVTRVGPGCETGLKPGDRVCMVAEGCMRKFPRAHEKRVLVVPDALPLDKAAAVLVPGMTAWYCLADVARLQKGERVLIHSAAGSTGQMAVRVAQALGAEVLATTSSPDKRRFLTEQFGIPDSHIFHSRTASFAKGVMRVTGGRGVDCVLNSLSGDGLRASWECMAPFGRFVDISLADINANAALPMAIFSKNVSFRAVHLMWLTPEVTATVLKETMRMLGETGPEPLRVFGLGEVEQAFRYLQSGKNIGRIVIAPTPEVVVPQLIMERRPWTFDANASYLVAGGFGGLGRAILKWMAGRGAKHFIVPCRSGPTSTAAKQLVDELAARNITVLAPSCDVSSKASLAAVLADAAASGAPPIKGCINASMVLQDAVFENMTFAQWDLTMRSKAQTAWNLHALLPRGLDFFVLLSSIAGVIGQASSANYSAGCAFQDALARHRVADCGERALSLDMGWIGNIGIIAETAAYQRRRQADQDLQVIEDVELLAMLTLACDPEKPLVQPAESAPGQVLFGLRTPADFLVVGEEPLAQLNRPLFGAFSYLPRSSASSSAAAAQRDQPAALFRRAADAGERAEVVLRALAAKLAVAMSISAGDIEPHKPLSSYGVDSLMAVELRNWIGREFAATMAVFDIMGGAPISSIAQLVVERSVVKDAE